MRTRVDCAQNEHGDIARARAKLQEIDRERAFYHKQAARGKMTEIEFDARMDKPQDMCRYWQAKVRRYKALRDNAQTVRRRMTSNHRPTMDNG